MNWLLDGSSIMLVLLAVAFVFAIVLLVIMKSPTFVPRRIIVDQILSVERQLFTHQMDARSLIRNCLTLLNHQAEATIATKTSQWRRKRHDMSNTIASAKTKLVPYARPRSQRQFYDLATTTTSAIEQRLQLLAQRVHDAVRIEPVFSRLAALYNHASNRVDFIPDTDPNQDDVAHAKQHISQIVAELGQIEQKISPKVFVTDEFRQIASQLLDELSRAQQDYNTLGRLLQQQRYREYNDQAGRLRSFYDRFDNDAFEPLATAGRDDSPADAYTRDLRRQAWN